MYSSDFDDQPFPINQKFRRQIVPGLILFIVALLAMTSWGARAVLQDVYLGIAQQRAEGIARGVMQSLPEIWSSIEQGEAIDPGAHNRLVQELAYEEKEFNLIKLKVYDSNRTVLYSTDRTEIGTVEAGGPLKKVFDRSRPVIIFKHEDGKALYELYVPVYDADQGIYAVFELYEPVEYLDGILLKVASPVVLIPGVFLLVLILALANLVARAQADINRRTQIMLELRKRLEVLVSDSAVKAAREAVATKAMPSEMRECALFYSDIRNFTQYAEQHVPEQVISFLNEIMTVQINIINQHQGDVDKMIGDAILACFSGPQAARNALAAAMEIQQRLKHMHFDRGIGIGVYTGKVIIGGIGPAERLDYTVIGDSVNVAARLCSLAKAYEVVADVASLQQAEQSGFQNEEQVYVKGREESIAIRRWSA